MTEVTRKNPKAFEKIDLALKALDGLTGKVGWFYNAVYEGGRPVAAVAAGNELGIASRSIPPRPFMRPTVAERKQAWRDTVAMASVAVLKGEISAEDAMAQLTKQAEGDVAKTITQVYDPPLSPITIWLRAKRRGLLGPDVTVTGKTVGEAARAVAAPGYVQPNVQTKPLNDSGHMFDTLSSKVERSS